MNRTYIEWLDYYENATKEDVIQDMMLDINSIKEKNQQITQLTNNWNELEEWLKSVVEYETLYKGNYMTVRGRLGQEVLDKMKEIKDTNN